MQVYGLTSEKLKLLTDAEFAELEFPPGLIFAACGRRTYTLFLNYVIMVYHSPLFAVSKHFSTFFKKVLARIYFYGKLFCKSS